MAQTNVQAFSGDVEISGETVLGTATYRKKIGWNRNALAYVYLGNIRTNNTTGIRLDVSLNSSNSGYEMYQFQITLNSNDESHAGGKMIYSTLGGDTGSVNKEVDIGYVYVGDGGAYEYQLWLKDPTTDNTGAMDAYLNCQGYYNFDTGVSDVAQGGAAPTNFNLGTVGVLVDRLGNVGIGTANPATPFHINKLTATINPKAHTTTEFIRLRGDKVTGETYAISGGIKLGGDTGGTATADGRIEFYANDGANAGNSYGDIPDNFVMCIRGDGRVGIGVTDPSDSLHVSGQISTQNGGGKTPAVLFRSGANNTNSWEVKANVSDSFAGDFTIDRLDAATKQKFIIKNNGNVGIGTASPRGGLEVVKASTSTNPITSTHGLTITNNQTYPIFGGLNYHTGITFRGYGFVSNISDLGKIAVQKINSANLGDSDMIFYTNYESDRGGGGPGDLYERVRIASAGNVGIGTNGPGHKLHVNGNVFGSGFFNKRQSFYMTPNVTYTVFTASSGMQGYVFLIGEGQIQASMRISWRSGWTSFYYSSVYAAGLNTWAVNGSNIWARHAQSGSKTAWCRVLTVGTV
jgi:hypothetical protein